MDEHFHETHPPGAGGSSSVFLDPLEILDMISITSGQTFLDLACGKGEYSIAASKIIGDKGIIYAVDLWEEGISALRDNIARCGIHNIEPIVTDVGQSLPIDDHVVDVCLMATVLHDLKRGSSAEGALKEVARALKESGRLAIIEFYKVEGPPGPPADIRLDPREVEEMLTPHGFTKIETQRISDHHYLIQFKKA